MKDLHVWFLALILFLTIASCKPEKPAPPITIPVDARVKFAGVYDVYDTLSNWKYEMEVSLHIGSTNLDSLFIANWGNAFDLYVQQDDGFQTEYLNMSGEFGIRDHLGRSWALIPDFDTLFNNRLVNDTIRISYLKDNIAFYVADSVSYFRQSYREFAVKRDWE